jgi:hypothetical protein
MNIHPVTTPGAATSIALTTSGFSGTTTCTTHVIRSKNRSKNKKRKNKLLADERRTMTTFIEIPAIKQYYKAKRFYCKTAKSNL